MPPSFVSQPSPPAGNDPARAKIVVPDHPEAVEDVAAVKLQKIARGKLGKNYVKRRRIRYHASATRIQAGFRGRRARVSTRRRMMERDAAVHIVSGGRVAVCQGTVTTVCQGTVTTVGQG